jgi:hypothetical protein
MRQEYQTTKEHFELFKSSCEKLIDVLGLRELDIYFKHETIDVDSMANYSYQYQASKCVLYLAESWNIEPTTQLVKEQAVHEVGHLLLGRMAAQARDRSFVEEEFTSAEHQVINRLIKILYKEL